MASLNETYSRIPFRLPTEPTPKAGLGASRAFSVDGYGIDEWRKLFTTRQLLAIGAFAEFCEAVSNTLWRRFTSRASCLRYLAVSVDKQIDRLSTQCRWDQGYTKIHSSFARFALPMLWDFCEGNPLSMNW